MTGSEEPVLSRSGLKLLNGRATGHPRYDLQDALGARMHVVAPHPYDSVAGIRASSVAEKPRAHKVRTLPCCIHEECMY